jgi:hypothetical protein
VGKLVAAFIMFLAASALAIHESKPPPPSPQTVTPVRHVDEPPPSRAIHDAVPPWVKYAPPPPLARPSSPPVIVVTQLPPRQFVITESEVGDVVDVVDKCPDQPNDSDDNDGCPDSEGSRNRIIEIE